MQIQDIPRAYIRTTFNALRAPLELTESLVRRGGDERPWPPSVAFTAVEGGVKQAVGTIVRDERLVEEGRMKQAAAKQLRQALLLGVVAEAGKEDAGERFVERRQRTERGRAIAERKATATKDAAERRAAAKKERLERKAEEVAEQDALLEEAVEETLNREARASRARQIREERSALAKERQAVAAEAKVADLEAEIEASRQERKSDS